jgi:DNA-binding MarR family transcriptional regulator
MRTKIGGMADVGQVNRAERSMRVFGLIARLVHQTTLDAESALRRDGLNPALFQMLLAVRQDPGAFQQAFGRRFGVTRANVSMLVTKLEQAGLVQREPAGAANRVWLTPAGQAVVARLEPAQDQFMTERFAALSDAQLEELGELVSVVLEGLSSPQ